MNLQDAGTQQVNFTKKKKPAAFSALLIKTNNASDVQVPIRKGQEFKVLEGFFFFGNRHTQSHTATPKQFSLFSFNLNHETSPSVFFLKKTHVTEPWKGNFPDLWWADTINSSAPIKGGSRGSSSVGVAAPSLPKENARILLLPQQHDWAKWKRRLQARRRQSP